MKVAFIDTSIVVALLFNEKESKSLGKTLARFDEIIGCSLLESEIFSVCKRENFDFENAVKALSGISLLIPDGSLQKEYTNILAKGFLRGTDLFHLGCALFLDPDATELTFLTLDKEQKAVAEKLGFKIR